MTLHWTVFPQTRFNGHHVDMVHVTKISKPLPEQTVLHSSTIPNKEQNSFGTLNINAEHVTWKKMSKRFINECLQSHHFNTTIYGVLIAGAITEEQWRPSAWFNLTIKSTDKQHGSNFHAQKFPKCRSPETAEKPNNNYEKESLRPTYLRARAQ